MIRIVASKKSDVSRGIEHFNVSVPKTTKDDVVDTIYDLADFLNNDYENLLSFRIECKKDS